MATVIMLDREMIITVDFSVYLMELKQKWLTLSTRITKHIDKLIDDIYHLRGWILYSGLRKRVSIPFCATWFSGIKSI